MKRHDQNSIKDGNIHKNSSIPKMKEIIQINSHKFYQASVGIILREKALVTTLLFSDPGRELG